MASFFGPTDFKLFIANNALNYRSQFSSGSIPLSAFGGGGDSSQTVNVFASNITAPLTLSMGTQGLAISANQLQAGSTYFVSAKGFVSWTVAPNTADALVVKLRCNNTNADTVSAQTVSPAIYSGVPGSTGFNLTGYVSPSVGSFLHADVFANVGDNAGYSITLTEATYQLVTATPEPINPLEPLANYDFTFYTANAATIENSEVGSPYGVASILVPTENTYWPGGNSYLWLQWQAYPLACGGLTTPAITNVQTVEIWMSITDSPPVGMYLVDFQLGQASGYIVCAPSGDGNVGSALVGGTVFVNGSPTVLTATTNVFPALTDMNWKQVVIVSPTPFSDDMSFLVNHLGSQGLPSQVAQVCVYQSQLTEAQVKTLFNNKCSRYGLPPLP